MPNSVQIRDSSEVELFTSTNPGVVSGTLTSTPGSQTLTHVSGTKAAAGGNELVAAPGAGLRIVVNMIAVQNESATATTVLLQNGASTAFRALLQSQASSISVSFAAGREWKLTENTALNLNLSGANSHGYMVAYYTESV